MKTEVLIVGAGPTGLMMACQLAMRDIPFRIIDKSADHTRQSRALVIHARTLEIFQQMGIADEVVRQGRIAQGINLVTNGKRSLHFKLGKIGNNLTDFPFLLILEQSKTEAILVQFLSRYNIDIERNIELLALSQKKKNVAAIIKNEKEEQETIISSWLIGADGTHSAVREHLKIPFPGKTYEQSLFVLDCEINLNYPPDEMYLSFSKETFAAFFPMTNGRCRVIGIVPPELEKKEELTFEDLNKNFAEKTRLNIKLQNPEWISKYHAHHRVVSSFRKGHCFLAGDSAHIHAQGMNTGLQDAYNLSWKLALVIRGKADEYLLSTYHKERIGIAKRIVKSTDRVFNLITSKKLLSKIFITQLIPFALSLLLPIAQKFPFIFRIAFKNISNIALNYRGSRLSREDNSSSFKNISLKPGDRIPYNWLRKNFTEGLNFHLLIFSKNGSGADAFEEICKPYSDLIKINEIPYNRNTEKIYKQFGIKDSGYYLIRPDSYIAYRSQSLNVENLKKYLAVSLKLKCVPVFLTNFANRYLSVFS
jgi:2-polyprenyl-6-methoxyphenol hydroxylase-like FAD-dependent oxidoreductase